MLPVKLPNIDVRDVIYRVCFIGAALAGILGETGIIPRPIALPIASLLGSIAGWLAKTAVKAQKRDDTLVLTGSVPEQVNKGLGILADQVAATIDQVGQIGQQADRLNRAKDQLADAVAGVPVLGPLAQTALKLP